jgi:hypothetical protein
VNSEFEQLVEAADDVELEDVDDLDDRKQRKDAAELLLELVGAAGVELFHDSEPRLYIRIPQHDDVVETYTLAPRPARQVLAWFRHLYYETTGSALKQQALEDALGVLQARAEFDGETRDVHVRLAGFAGNIYLDLGDPQWRIVEIDHSGWRLLSSRQAPVVFRRPSGLRPLPIPERGGTLDELRPFLNVASDDDFALIVGWLLCALRPDVPYPVLATHGEQGSAKSTVGRVLRELVDPNKADLRSASRETRDLVLAAHNAWVVTFDNLSHVSQGLSDDICRLATGGGFATRQLYRDEDEVIIDVRRPVIINGIEEIATSGDLVDRQLLVRLPRIPEVHRVEERLFWEKFERARPRVLGAILDALAAGLRELPNVDLDRLPRMADMATWMTAIETGLGRNPAFLAAYYRRRAEANELVIESHIVGVPLLAIMATGFEGTATELLEQVTTEAGETLARSKGFPKTARAMSAALQRLGPALREAGYDVEHDRQRTRRVWRLGPCDKAHDVNGRNGIFVTASEPTGTRAVSELPNLDVPDKPSQPSQPSPPAQRGGNAGDVRDGSSVTSDAYAAEPSLGVPLHDAIRDGRDGCDGRSGTSELSATEQQILADFQALADGSLGL